jgi:hypothetical protein
MKDYEASLPENLSGRMDQVMKQQSVMLAWTLYFLGNSKARIIQILSAFTDFGVNSR